MKNKKTLFAANWKLHKTPQQTRQFFSEFKKIHPQDRWAQTLFFVPATNLEAACEATQATGIQLGAQNCYSQKSGAFTGEISAEVVKEMGAGAILLGHSERRQYFGETDELIAAKGRLVQELGLLPVLCIGESLQQRESHQTESVCESQLMAFIKAIDVKKNWVIAYEPVWAIGTGRVATLEQVAAAHAFIRKLVTQCGADPSMMILYGGSVKPDNASALLEIPDVNGFLVGGASLEAGSFSQICLA